MQCQLHILEALRVRLPVGATRQAGGYETEITHPNKIKRPNQVLVGTDPVLMDAYACVNYFAVKPQELAHVKVAADMGLGELDVDKATKEGRFRAYTVGQPISTPTPVVTPTKPIVLATSTGAAPAVPAPAAPAATATPQPAPTEGPVEVAQVPSVPERPSASAEQVLNPAPFLSGALIPAAAVLAGVGLVARRVLDRPDQSEEPQDEQAG
jgi:hypothetical protein